MVASSSNFYQVGASLPIDAPSYVQRQADEEFYQKLRSGKFCYVLNSRQMGKSSLRVQTMQRLQSEGTICAAIDLTGIGKHKVTISQWYGGIVYGLVESCQLEDKFDFDWQTWWLKKQSTLDPVMCLRLFIEQVLLEKIQQPIVIFVDEIDRVLSQDFSLDDFFALIRFFQNQRVDNPIFERLTFALLGVATPSDLITDKTQTPFNIGEGIELHGFRLEEVQPLINGLQGKVSNPQQVMEEILDWTGGQPFLTQKLCKFMVEESEKDNPRSVGEIVRARIIANWESQDNPEHLRTIRDRILSNEQRANYLLELYQQIRQEGEIASNNSIEVSELQLSGLVVKRQEKLRAYNRIYQQIFDLYWIEKQLKNLRPYSENFRFWVASGGNDESRLLRGKALQEAEEWAKEKNLSYQDKQFLAASKEKEIQEEIAAQEKEAQLERERKDREAAESRNILLTEANIKAKRQIRKGSTVLFLALFVAVVLGIFAATEGNKALQAEKMSEDANTKAEEAHKKFEDAKTKAINKGKEVKALQQQAQQAKRNADTANQKAVEATKQSHAEQQKAQQAKRNADTANQKATEASKQAEAEQQNAQQANGQAINARKQAEAEQRKAQQANRQAREATTKAQNFQNQFTLVKTDVETVQKLSELAGDLRNKNLTSESDEALRLAALSFNVKDHQLKQALLLASISQAYQQLEKWDEAEQGIKNSNEILLQTDKNSITSNQGLQIQVLADKTQGSFLAKKKQINQAIESYKLAFKILKTYPEQTSPFTKSNPFITAKNIESVHRGLIQQLSKNNTESELRKQVEKSLTQHLYAQLEYSLNAQNWKAADIQTYRLMLNIAKREKERYLDYDSINSFSCPDLGKIDQLWLANSDNRFGFSVQKEIWINTGNRLGIKPEDLTPKDSENYLRFATAVGWNNDKKSKDNETGGSRGDGRIVTLSYEEVIVGIKDNLTLR